jgi:hypothetical protein
MSKHFDNMRRERARKLKPGIQFSDAYTETTAGKEAVSTLLERLQKEDFDDAEAQLIANAAQVARFEEGQTLLEAGVTWPYVMVVISGTLTVDKYNLELQAGVSRAAHPSNPRCCVAPRAAPPRAPSRWMSPSGSISVLARRP